MLRYVADLGNSRIKWAQVLTTGELGSTQAWLLHPDSGWKLALRGLLERGESTGWAISSVNPPLSKEFDRFVSAGARARWFRSASDVPVRHELESPSTTGADRALAVLAATRIAPAGRAGLVISCGTAITLERISAAGIWEGGVIAPGVTLIAQALHHLTAQLPRVEIAEAPPAWGRATIPSLQAGVFWGAVGAVRELVGRQDPLGSTPRWKIWTGGDSQMLARHVDGPSACIEPDLVLHGLAFVTINDEAGP